MTTVINNGFEGLEGGEIVRVWNRNKSQNGQNKLENKNKKRKKEGKVE